MTQPGAEQPAPPGPGIQADPAGPDGQPDPVVEASSGGGVTVRTPSVTVTEVARQTAGKLAAEGVPEALVSADVGLWGPAVRREAAARLGWLRAPEVSRALLPEIAGLAERTRGDGLDHIVLAGMGGSSLAPGVISATAGAALTVLDTTDAHEVSRVLADRPERTLVVVSSKSGSTVETDSHRRIYEDVFARLGLSEADIARRFVVVTDPGSPLEKTAGDAGYHVVRADPHVGGRYSALTAFGLVPSALAGADIGRLLADADAAAATLTDPEGPGTMLGAALGGYAAAGHDKAVLADCGPRPTGFGDWVEQLIAESTGKEGHGILPVVIDGEDAPGFSPGPDVHLIALGEPEAGPEGDRPAKPADTVVTGPLGAQFIVWEYAVAVAGRIIGINPFNQPDVAESKRNTASLLEQAGDGPLPAGQPAFTDGAVEVHGDPGLLNGIDNLPAVFDALLLALPERGYVAVMAYLDRTGDSRARDLRGALAARTTHPVTFGWGPRMLHSTGQYHKGGPGTGVFIQVTGDITEDVNVPGRPYTLGRLQLAQALGDLDALRSRGRPAVRIHLRDRARGLAQLIDAAAARGIGER